MVKNPLMSYNLRYLISVGIMIVSILIAVSMRYTPTFTIHIFSIYVSKEVEGSGIPEIKAIIAGIQIPKYLNLNTGLAKLVGNMAVLIGGFPVGREGPFIHLSACIA